MGDIGLLSMETRQRIHKGALDVLKTVGVRVDHEGCPPRRSPDQIVEP